MFIEKIFPIKINKSNLRYTKKNVYKTIQRIVSQAFQLEYLVLNNIYFPSLKSFIDTLPPYFDTNSLRWTPTLGVKGRIFKLKDQNTQISYIGRWHRHKSQIHTAECYTPKRPKIIINVIAPTTSFTIDRFLELLLLSRSQPMFTKLTEKYVDPSDPLEAIFWRNLYFSDLQKQYEYKQMMDYHFKGSQGCLSYTQSQIKPIFLQHKRYKNYLSN